MTAEENVALYRRWLDEIWTKGNYAVAPDILAEDLIDHTPMQGQPSGRAGDLWAAAQIRKAFPDMHFSLDVVFADDQYVTGRWTMTATNTGPFDLFGIPPTGRPIAMGGQEIFKVRDGRLAEVWHCEDTPSMLQQLRLGPPPAFIMRASARRSARRYRREQRAER